MAVREAQIEDLEGYISHSLNSFKQEGNVITLTRADGLSFSFTIEKEDGPQGSQGDKGPKGDQGESAFEIAKRLGLTDELTWQSWISSLVGNKGDTGNKGADGKNGKNGINGVIPGIRFAPTVWGTDKIGGTITNNNNTYTIGLQIPLKAAGVAGKDGIRPTLTIGEVTFDDLRNLGASALLDREENSYTLNLTIPRGLTGDDGTNTVGKNTYGPEISFVVNYEEVDEPKITSTSTPKYDESWKQIFYFTIPRGQRGERGEMGAQGNRSTISSTAEFKIITNAEYINNPGKGFSTFRCDIFGDEKSLAYGYTWRTDETTRQLVRVEGTDHTGWYYRVGPATGKINTDIHTGWIPASLEF